MTNKLEPEAYWCPECREICSVKYDIDISYDEDNVWFCFRCQMPNHKEKWKKEASWSESDIQRMIDDIREDDVIDPRAGLKQLKLRLKNKVKQ